MDFSRDRNMKRGRAASWHSRMVAISTVMGRLMLGFGYAVFASGCAHEYAVVFQRSRLSAKVVAFARPGGSECFESEDGTFYTIQFVSEKRLDTMLQMQTAMIEEREIVEAIVADKAVARWEELFSEACDRQGLLLSRDFHVGFKFVEDTLHDLPVVTISPHRGTAHSALADLARQLNCVILWYGDCRVVLMTIEDFSKSARFPDGTVTVSTAVNVAVGKASEGRRPRDHSSDGVPEGQ